MVDDHPMKDVKEISQDCHPLSHSGLSSEQGGHWIYSEDFQRSWSCDLGRKAVATGDW
jgi:hypothetical protein